MAQFTFYKLSCNFKSERVYDPELVHADEYSFGMLAGARAWVERHRDELVWCSTLLASTNKETSPFY